MLSDFDIMFNKNPFALSISGAAGKFNLPAAGQSAYTLLPCQINPAKNLDNKNPPKYPFLIQIAMKTSLDVFYYTLPCKIHCFINVNQKLTKEDFQTNW